MNKLEITEEQKSKFEEMFNFFFPEFKENLKDEKPVQFLYNDNVRIYDFRDKIKPKLIEVPWFEFCLTELSKKVLPGKLLIAYGRYDFEIHPEEGEEYIEYLNEFKTSDYYEELQSGFSLFEDKEMTIYYWTNNSEEPSLIYYKGNYFEYNRKYILVDLPIVKDINSYIDVYKLREATKKFLYSVIIENEHPVDYLYKLFLSLKD